MPVKKPEPKTTSSSRKSPSPSRSSQQEKYTSYAAPKSLKADPNKGNYTKITIKFDCGYPNTLYIRGKGSNLSWEKGLALKNVKHDEWVYETNDPTLEFKVLINDRHYEQGENHRVNHSGNFQYHPKF
jgi:hypothetical protein